MTVSRKYMGLALAFTVMTSTITAALTAQEGQNIAMLQQVIDRYGDYQVFEGAVLVARGDDVLLTKGTGYANREWGTVNGPDVKYRIASLTKGFTAALMLRLVDEGKLKLSDTLQQHMPDYTGEKADVITIEQMLRHTAGFQHTIALPGWFVGAFRRDISPEDYIREIEKLPLIGAPGERYNYSNLDYYLLGKIAEKLTGQTYEEALKTRFFDPLGMQDTGVDQAGTILAKRADGYVWARGGGYRNQGYNNMDVFGAGAALYSTVHDLFLWQKGLRTGDLLSDASKALMFEEGNAIGWRVEDWQQEDGGAVRTVNYDGQIDGFSSYIAHFEGEDITVVLLGNIGTGGWNKAQMTLDLKDAVNGVVQSKLPLMFHLTKSVTEGALEEGIAAYEAAPEKFSISEELLQGLGTQLGWGQLPQRALMVRALTARLFPESAMAQARLGQASLAAGDTAQAKAAFEAALALKPAEGVAAYVQQQLEALNQ